MSSGVPRAAIVELLTAFGRAMQERGFRWYVFGGQAVLAYGRPRMTMDVDITVNVAAPAELLAALEPHGIEPRFPLSDDLLTRLRLLPMMHLPTQIPIDLVMAGGGLEEDLLARVCLVDVGGVEVPMISVEDLIALKVLAGRRKDLDDVRGVLAEQRGRIALDLTREVLAAFEEATGERKLVARLERLLGAKAAKKRTRRTSTRR